MKKIDTKNLFYENVERFEADKQKIIKLFDVFLDLNKKARSLGIKPVLVGGMSLICNSGKFYRTPSDIDLSIESNDFINFLKILEKEWNPYRGLQFKNLFNGLERFFKKIQTFACINPRTIIIKEEEGALFLLKNKKCTIHSYEKKNGGQNIENVLDFNTETLIHNPESEYENIKTDFFGKEMQINFAATHVGKFSEAYVIFYDKNFVKKEAFQCFWVKNTNREGLGDHEIWRSPKINANIFENCFYRIFFVKRQVQIMFTNILDKSIKLDCFIKNIFLENLKIPVRFIGDKIVDPQEFLINGEKALVTSKKCALFINKLERSKDAVDKNFF